MTKEATLGLLRTLRERDTSARAEQAVAAAERRAQAEHAAEHATATRTRAVADAEEAALAERRLLETGAATAGDLGRGYHHRRGVEARAERSERERARTEEELAQARIEETRAAAGLEQALARQSVVTERIADGAARERERLERRDEEAMAEAWNARRGDGRSRG